MKRIHDFHGGIHPPERKELSNGTPIRRMALPQQLVLPLAQHIGPPAKVAVALGDEVLVDPLPQDRAHEKIGGQKGGGHGEGEDDAVKRRQPDAQGLADPNPL